MHKRRWARWLWAMGLLGLGQLPTVTGHAGETSLSGFGDINIGYGFGSVRDDTAAARFETYGLDPEPKSSHNGFGLAGTDFVLTNDLTDDLIFLTEINLQVARGQRSEFELDVERMYFEKRFDPKFILQAGLFFTPVGYFNRTLYSRAWMMISAQVPDLFEEEYGLVPTHSIGLAARGQFELGADHRLNYVVSLTNQRAPDPSGAVYARVSEKRPTVTGMLEWMIPGFRDARVGLSGWYERISSYRLSQLGATASIIDPTTAAMTLNEIGVDVHLVLRAKRMNFIGEYVYQRHRDTNKTIVDRTTILHGALVEVSLNLLSDGRLKPYLRYDLVKLPDDGGPYFGIRQEGDDIARFYVPETNMVIGGIAYDVNALQRVKLEYSNALAGVRKQHAVMVQSAFAF